MLPPNTTRRPSALPLIFLAFLVCLPAPSSAYKAKLLRQIFLGSGTSVESATGGPRIGSFLRDNSATSGDDQALSGGPLIRGCYTVDLVIQNQKFSVLLDSGSTDLLIPGTGLPAYPATSPSYNYAGKTGISGSVSTTFMDGSSWSGQFYKDDVSIVTSDGRTLRVSAPMAVMKDQTTNPTVTSGSGSNGLLGIAFDSIASYSGNPPHSFMSALVQSSIVSKDRVAFRGCPATSSTGSYVDWGAQATDLATCKTSTDEIPGVLGWAKVVDSTHYSVDVRAITITTSAGVATSVALPSGWQSGGANGHSIVDSCTTVLVLPSAAQQALVQAVKSSGAFANSGLSAAGIDSFLTNLQAVSGVTNIDYSLLPSITFTLTGASSGTVDVTLTGKNYIQGNGGGWLFFVVQPTSDTKVVLGAVVYDSFYIVMDRANARVGFGLGCDCNTSNNPSSVTAHA
ncbi:aspartic peptidase domain-containing protein [Zopfochytrium polystomum]|nr:aspartic peptidase domain-containing protein [Zopfochytrium polystomum]